MAAGVVEKCLGEPGWSLPDEASGADEDVKVESQHDDEVERVTKVLAPPEKNRGAMV